MQHDKTAESRQGLTPITAIKFNSNIVIDRGNLPIHHTSKPRHSQYTIYVTAFTTCSHRMLMISKKYKNEIAKQK